MQSKTFAQLKREFFDRFDEGQSKYIEDAEAGRLINEAASHLHNWITVQNPQYLYRESKLPVKPQDMSCGLPENFARAVKVWADKWELEPLSLAKYGDNRSRGYFQRGQRLYLQGVGGMGGYPVEIVLGYVPHFIPMQGNADTLTSSVAPGYDSYIINLAVMNAKVKEESPINDLAALNSKIEDLILQDILARKQEERNQVVDRDPLYTAGLGLDRWGP